MTFETLWDWRRQTADLYAAVRAAPDPEHAWRQWCAARDRMFRTHPQTPIERDQASRFGGLKLFPYDPALRFTVRLLPDEGAAELFPAGADGDLHVVPFAQTDGLAAALGGELTLYWLLGYGGGTFLPFKDATSGRSTYGGGRYLLDTIKGADLGVAMDGRTVLDFNFAYNPSCAYSSRYICPLAPPGNRFPTSVRAGEKAPG